MVVVDTCLQVAGASFNKLWECSAPVQVVMKQQLSGKVKVGIVYIEILVYI